MPGPAKRDGMGIVTNLKGKGRLDWLLRMQPELEDAYERDFGASRIQHLRHAIIIGLIVYNVYNLTSLHLMGDIQPFTVAMRLFVLTPGSILIFLLVPRLPPKWRELLLLQGMFTASLLPLYLVYVSQSPYASYTLGELPLVLLFGNMLLVLRFRLALIFTTATCLAALWVVHNKPGLDPNLLFPLTVQIVTGLFFTLYGNWHFERQRCLSYLAQHDAQNRADRAERIGDAMRDLSRIDMLTGIANRRHLDETLGRWIGEPGARALLMVDIDHFKAYNDRLGHLAGDDCLRRVAEALSRFAARHDGFVGRYGGEEFMALFQLDSADHADMLAHRMVKAVHDLAIPHPDQPGGQIRVTISVGYALTSGGETTDTLITRADAALYAAKRRGRNQAMAA